MSLNIKSDEAQRLARELANLTGETLTGAVTHALRDRLQQEQLRRHVSRADRLLAIGRDAAAHLQEPFRSADHTDLLYDERGLPR